MEKSKYDITIDTTVGAAVGDALDEFESLGGEMANWRDNMPENLQSGDKYQEVSDSANALESIGTELEVPEVVSDLPVKYVENQKRKSRAARCEYACNLLQHAIEATMKWIEKRKSDGQPDDEDVSNFLDAAGEALESAEGAEFPGMV